MLTCVPGLTMGVGLAEMCEGFMRAEGSMAPPAPAPAPEEEAAGGAPPGRTGGAAMVAVL